DPKDYKGISSEEIAQNMIASIHAGSISILHDGSEIDHEKATRPRNTLEALMSVIPKLQESLSLVRVDQMTLESQYGL
ncbi:MAG: hypothetical protein K0R24_1822, partial [Gammaproteobacteria bacterium]|nr:hypothetical protein [Gammaproteobacteria bacterium]